VKGLARFYLKGPVTVEPGAASKWLEMEDDFTLVTSKSPASHFKSIIDKSSPKIILDPPIEMEDLDQLVPEINTKWIVGIGGGRVNDASKYLALRAKKKLCLIPSILSTTSWLNMAIALRKDNILVFPGEKHAKKIIIDSELVSKAPASLNIGGLADLLCSASAMGDWIISHEKIGEKISKRAVDEFQKYVDGIVENVEILDPFTESTVEYIYKTFLEGLCLCGASFSGRPVEGSEHFMYYYFDELDDRRFNHGKVIALNTLIALKLQGNRRLVSFKTIQDFFDNAKIPYKPSDVGLTREDLERMFLEIKAFVEKRDLPHSILNEVDFHEGSEELQEMVDWIFTL
jgi:glycerol dehydrogenase-like iron-containing ADH family enzyme